MLTGYKEEYQVCSWNGQKCLHINQIILTIQKHIHISFEVHSKSKI